MKKFIVSIALSLLVFTGRTLAATGDNGVPEPVNSVFNERFPEVKDVAWETGKDFYKAGFDMRGRMVFAYFAANGDLMGIASNLSPFKLPKTLKSALKSNYANYWITDLVKYRIAEEDGLVVTLEDADKVIVLKALGTQGWRVYKTKAKN